MSYILEALRKAERERNAGQAPDLQGAPHQQPSMASTRPLTRQWLSLGAAIVAGLSIGLVLWLRPSHTPTRLVAAEPASEPISVNEVPPDTVPVNTVGNVAHLDDLLDKSAPALPLEEQRKLSASLVLAPALGPVSIPTLVPTQHRILPEQPSSIEETEPAPTLAEQATAEPELPPELKKLKEMPNDYRGGFPTIRVDVHAYDDQPSKRFVMINGRRYHEGDVIAEGPTVVSIEEDGIVFNYHNQEVLYPIGR